MRINHKYDIYGRTEPSIIYLAKPGKRLYCALDGVDTSTVSLSLKTNNTAELTFTVDKYIDNTITDGYEELDELMELYCDGIWFKIVDPPTINNDGLRETKDITAESYEIMLTQYKLKSFKINMGEEDSYEMMYQASHDTSQFYQITFYDPENEDLSFLHLVLKHADVPGWHIGYVDNITPDDDGKLLPNNICNFEVDDQNVYAFLTQEAAQAYKCVFEFDTVNMTINVYRPDSLGKDTNVVLGFRNIQNSISISREENLVTQFYVEGLDSYNIDAVNFGDSVITDLSYFVREPYMNATLQEKYNAWQDYRESRREEFMNLSATLPGISTKVDRSVFYKDYSKSSSTSTNTSTNSKGDDKMTTEKAINALIATAEKEVGYLEKTSNSQLDSKTGNAGYNNYTKYWRDVYPQYQAQAWCAAFVSWCMMKTFGLDTAKKLLKHWPYVYCPTLGSLFTKYANPQRGDIVIFYRNGTFAHTGIVTKVDGDKFYTIEGNTSAGTSVVPNGGGVYAKSYYNAQLPGTKFCRPDYSIVTSILTSNTSSGSSNSSSNPSYIAWVGSCTVDGTDVFSGAAGASKLATYPKLNKGNLVDIIGESGTRYQVRIATKYVGYVEKSNIKNPNAPATTTTTKKYPFVGKVTANELNVRTGAGTNYSKLSAYPLLKKDNLVDVLSVTKDTAGSKWYKVKIAGKYTGYVSAQYITKA